MSTVEAVEGAAAATPVKTEKKKQRPRIEEPGPVDLPLGKLVARRWKIIDKLGEGGCGAVYLVEDVKRHRKAALKAESNFVAGGSVLKLEVQILRKLVGRKYVAQLLASGKKEKYGYMVMTLFGPSLCHLFKLCKKEFTISTLVRVGMQILYGLKQIHEIGYVHRDVKPANLAIGLNGKESKVVHVLDFGLSREFVVKNPETEKTEMRRPRRNTLFRGTIKYCSVNSHERGEQGRPDDLWSMVYILVEMRGRLAWEKCHDKHQIGKIKKELADEKLLQRCPAQMLEITAHLRELNYYVRPDYLRIYSIFEDIMNEYNIKHTDSFDWEKANGITEKMTAGKFRRKISKILTVSEDKSIRKTSEYQAPSNSKYQAPSNSKYDKTQDDSEEKPPFTAEEFEKNELGF